jgi:mannose-1-phosphate guanylyltransferase
MQIKALVLAAGMGSRLRAIAGDLPKPLMPFGGRPILLHNLYWLARSGVSDVWINLHYGADQIKAAVAADTPAGLEVSYSFEPELLGTAGALGNIKALHDGPSLVVYGDNILKLDLEAMAKAHAQSGAAITIALFDRDQHHHTGIAGGRVKLSTNGAVEAFVEGAGAAEVSALVNAGVYLIEPGLAAMIEPGVPVDFGRDIFPGLLADGRGIHGHIIEADGFCLGLDTPESLKAGQDLLDAGKISLV